MFIAYINNEYESRKKQKNPSSQFPHDLYKWASSNLLPAHQQYWLTRVTIRLQRHTAGAKLTYLRLDSALRFTFWGRNGRFDSVSCSTLPLSTLLMDKNQQRRFRVCPCLHSSGGARAPAVIHVIITARPIPQRPLRPAHIIHDGATRENFHRHFPKELEYTT